MSAPVKVWSLLCYLTEIDGIAWRDVDYVTNKIIKAVKGQPINGYFNIQIGGKPKTFNQTNVEEFMGPLFQAVAEKLNELIKGEFDLIPIPNSNATVAEEKTDFKTWAHARAIAGIVGKRAHAVPALRWDKAKIPAHAGGSRDPQVHFENLRVVGKPANQVVLFDDVLTTGSQMIASYRRLAKSGFVPKLSIVVGRATKEQKDPAIGWNEEDLETAEIPFNWNDFLNKNK